MNRTLILALAVLPMIVGCAAREELVAKNAVAATPGNLSGYWQLREAGDNSLQRISRAERRAAGGEQRVVPTRKSRQTGTEKRKAGETSVNVFLETGRALKITQTDFGLFISFDRSVVEEYRFGEKREINVGPIVADRVSGWEGGAYVIETLDQEGAKLIESYRLDAATGTLVRSIRVVYKEEEQLNVEQVFDPA